MLPVSVPRPLRRSAPLLAVLALALAGCGGSGDSPTTAASAPDSSAAPSSSAGAEQAAFPPGQDIEVRAGDRTCDVAHTTLQAGKHTFEVKNTGGSVTEVYVYAPSDGGSFNKIVGEVEDVVPGVTRELPVSVSAGSYQVACKPGQTGDGIRTTLTVVGEGGAASTEAGYDREVEVTARDFAFTGLADFTAKAGEKIEFKLENTGAVEHELEILGPDGKQVAEIGPTPAGKDGEVVAALTVPGTYTYQDGLADHAARGMKGTFTVS